MKRVLALDTATPSLSLAVVQISDAGKGSVLASRDRPPGPNHSVLLPGLVAEALEEAGLTLAELDGIAVGIGPGAFTGLRVSLATAKGLAYAANKPLAGVSSLAAMALAAARLVPQAGAIIPVLDARKGEVYAGFFGPDGVTEIAPEVALSPEALAARLAGLAAPVVLLGEGFFAFRRLLDDATAGRGALAPGLPETPPALELAELAAPRLGAFSAQAVFALEPRYLRSSDADLSLGPRPV